MDARAQLVGRLLRVMVLAFALWVAIDMLDLRGPTRTCLVACYEPREYGGARQGVRRSADMSVDDKDFAREALDGFFRRRGEAGKFYCAACLAQRLTRRGIGAFPLAAVKAAVADAFERPGLLRLKPRGRCGACKQGRPCIGTTAVG